MKKIQILGVLLLCTLPASAGKVKRLAGKDARDFTHYFTGDMIFSKGGEFLNGWKESGEVTDGTMSLTTRGKLLKMVTSEGQNGWLEGSLSTNGRVTWDEGVSGFADSYTVEIGFRLNDTDPSNNGFRLWMGHDEGRDILTIYEDRITITKPGGGFGDIPKDLTDGFHTLRLAHLGPKNKDPEVISETQKVVHVWLDGVRLTHPKGNPLTHREDDSRLIIGDTTDARMGDHLDIDFTHIAYDVDAAFAPPARVPTVDPGFCPDPESPLVRALRQSKLEKLREVEGQLSRSPRD